MNQVSIALLCLVFLVSHTQPEKTRSLKASRNRDLHADLTRAVVRSSDWLRQYYRNTPSIQPYAASSMIVSLRLAGHKPDALLHDFKNNLGLSINETLKNYLDTANITEIPLGQLAHIVQGVIALCDDPRDFYGHNLIDALLAGIPNFKQSPDFNNYFQYSLVAIALCNSKEPIPEIMAAELIKGAGRPPSLFVDIDALILIALSCLEESANITSAKRVVIRKILDRQDKETGAFGNQYSTALAAEALLAAGVNSYWCWSYTKSMKNVLSYQDEQGSFGTLLANVQITPSLLGQSMLHLKELKCPVKATPKPVKDITVTVSLVFNDTVNPVRTEPPVAVTTKNGTTAYNILIDAGLQNPCYTAVFKNYTWGHYIVGICGVSQNRTANLYWMFYVNGLLASYGVDGIKPDDGTLLTFKYQKVYF